MRGASPLTLVLFVVGAIALLLAEATWLRTVSALVLVASMVSGVYAIATPAFLEEDRD